MHTLFLLLIPFLPLLTSALSPLQNQLPISPAGPCGTTFLPVSYQDIVQQQPLTSFPQARFFNVSSGSSPGSTVDSLIHFTGIPAGSFGCTLGVSFTFEFPISSSGSTLLSVYNLLNHDITSGSDYAGYYPGGGSGEPSSAEGLFGSLTLDGEPHTVNSAACTGNMSFLVAIASDTLAGSVSFQDQGDNLSGIGGFYLSFDC